MKYKLIRNVGTKDCDEGETTRHCQKPYRAGQVLDGKELRPAELKWLAENNLVEEVLQ